MRGEEASYFFGISLLIVLEVLHPLQDALEGLEGPEPQESPHTVDT